MTTSDKRRNRTCIVCRKRIEPNVLPWSMVGISGDTVFWHPACDAEKSRRG